MPVLGLNGVEDVERQRRDSVALRTSAYVGVIIALTGLIFTAGYNWRQVVEVSNQQAVMIVELKADYVRKDVNREQMEALNKQLDEIRRLLVAPASRH